MRIASDFRDYYDVAMAEGQDQTLVYQRYPIVEEHKHYPFSSMFGRSSTRYRREREWSLYVQSYTIGFCGQFYKVLELNTPENGLRNDKEGRSTRKWCYNLGDVDSYVKRYYSKQYNDYLERHWKKGNGWNSEQRQHSFDNFFNGLPRSKWQKEPTVDEQKRTQAWRDSWFLNHRSPLFVAEFVGEGYEAKITYNGLLKPFEFYRIFDPYLAFQEISMWLGNQAVPIKPIPKLDDVTMAEIKGFDKFSFRKDPGKKKKVKT